jgi:hypothetical protein
VSVSVSVSGRGGGGATQINQAVRGAESKQKLGNFAAEGSLLNAWTGRLGRVAPTAGC